jgi:hypothetical protein
VSEDAREHRDDRPDRRRAQRRRVVADQDGDVVLADVSQPIAPEARDQAHLDGPPVALAGGRAQMVLGGQPLAGELREGRLDRDDPLAGAASTPKGGAIVARCTRVAIAQDDRELAERLLQWIEASATSEGHLPEQVADNVQSPHMLRYWRRRWGHTATPLLWSHAMHLILLDHLGRLPDH